MKNTIDSKQTIGMLIFLCRNKDVYFNLILSFFSVSSISIIDLVQEQTLM